MNQIEPLLLPAEVSEILRITTGQLANWRCEGRGPKYVKNGGDQRSRVFYRRSDVDAFIEGNVREAV